MNSFRSLVQDINSEVGVDVPTVFTDDEFTAVEGIVSRAASDAQCFWLGDGDQFTDVNFVKECLKLPFQTCWFEWDWRTEENGYFIVGLLCNENADGSIDCVQLRKKKGRWMLTNYIFLTNGFNSGSVIHASKSQQGDDESNKLLGTGTANLLKGILTIINCSNVCRIKVEPSGKLQKNAEKNGRLPFFSYWTLEIGGEPMTGKDNSRKGGGTPPRMHVRRGHARQYAPGKYTWVSPCMVGNKELGTIHKDYSVKVSP